jgi:GntR family transcriptional regulator
LTFKGTAIRQAGLTSQGRTPRVGEDGADSWTAARIDRESPIPYYYQLQEILKQEIEDGRWPPGALLPSEAELAASLGISRTVIRQALDVLEGDGQVRRVKGKGTVVAPPKFRYEAMAAARHWLSPDLASTVVLRKLIRVSSVPAGGHFSRLLQVTPTDELWQIVFVSAVAGKSVSLSDMYMRKDASPELLAASLRSSSLALSEGAADVLQQIGERYRVAVAQSEITVESTVANQFEAAELGISESTPVFLLSSLSIGPDDRPLAFMRTVVRSDHFRFSVLIRHPASDPSHARQPEFITSR